MFHNLTTRTNLFVGLNPKVPLRFDMFFVTEPNNAAMLTARACARSAKAFSYLGSDIWLGTRPCSWNCWHCQSSRRNRSGGTGESCCRTCSVTAALDRDREPLLNGTGSSHLPDEDKGQVLVTHCQHAVAKTVAKYKQCSKLDRGCKSVYRHVSLY